MEKINVNLMDATNYLIQLFYKSNKKYSCTRTKIGKLLSIVAFAFAKNGQQLFAEKIYRYGGCGVCINELKSFVAREIYLNDGYLDDKQYINDTLDESVLLPPQYASILCLSDDSKAAIEKVFRTFGSYSAIDLGKCINPIVNHEGITDEKDECVQLSEFKNLSYDEFVNERNELIDYIFIGNCNEELNNGVEITEKNNESN